MTYRKQSWRKKKLELEKQNKVNKSFNTFLVLVEKMFFIISDDVPKEISENVQREAELEVVDDDK
jgi:hypothetical protein